MKAKDTEKNFTDEKTDGISKNNEGEQTIQTENTETLKKDGVDNDKEILVGKKIEDVKEIKEGSNNLQKKILEKLMK